MHTKNEKLVTEIRRAILTFNKIAVMILHWFQKIKTAEFFPFLYYYGPPSYLFDFFKIYIVYVNETVPKILLFRLNFA